jgi:hypothetical protein
MDCQLINNAIHLLPTTGLYLRPDEEWDRLLPAAQTWTALCTMIQELFQHRPNATTPMTGHQGYAPMLLYLQNTFGVFKHLRL